MNKLIIYADERKMENSETKTKVIIYINNTTHEIYLNKESIDKLVKSDKFIIETKTFTDKILEEFNKTKPNFCND